MIQWKILNCIIVIYHMWIQVSYYTGWFTHFVNWNQINSPFKKVKGTLDDPSQIESNTEEDLSHDRVEKVRVRNGRKTACGSCVRTLWYGLQCPPVHRRLSANMHRVPRSSRTLLSAQTRTRWCRCQPRTQLTLAFLALVAFCLLDTASAGMSFIYLHVLIDIISSIHSQTIKLVLLCILFFNIY